MESTSAPNVLWLIAIVTVGAGPQAGLQAGTQTGLQGLPIQLCDQVVRRMSLLSG